MTGTGRGHRAAARVVALLVAAVALVVGPGCSGAGPRGRAAAAATAASSTTAAPTTTTPTTTAPTTVVRPAAVVVTAVESREEGGTGARRSVTWGDRPRTWRTFTPDDLGAGRGLVVVLHGRGGTGEAMQRLGFDALGRSQHAEVAYPDAVEGSWNDGRAGVDAVASAERVDDVGFLNALVDEAVTRRGVDPDRVAVVGYSNGGFMAGALACQPAAFVRAAVLVAGPGGIEVPSTCRPGAPVSVLVVHGTADGVVPYDGGKVAAPDGRARGTAAAVRSVVDLWRRWDGCGDAVVLPQPGPPAVVEERAACRSGTVVSLLTIPGGSHTWPLAPGFDPVATAARFLGETSPPR